MLLAYPYPQVLSGTLGAICPAPIQKETFPPLRQHRQTSVSPLHLGAAPYIPSCQIPAFSGFLTSSYTPHCTDKIIDVKPLFLLTCPVVVRTIFSMNKSSIQDRIRVISCLVEGNSINSTVRMTGIAKTTILRLIKQLADACQKMHDEKVCNLTSKRLQMDEVWTFVGAKEKNASDEKKANLRWGDTWTWTTIDADSKLMVSWIVGPRHAGTANEIARDVAWRMANRVQVTSDGFHAYWDAVGNAFNCEADFAQLVKIYGPEYGRTGKYSPSECIGIEIKPRFGNPDPKHISTSFVERSNLTLRMGTRRYTRLTNAHSKKIENHIAMTTIFFTYYNWCRIHQSLKVTPAMEAGLTNRLWEIEDLMKLVD